MVPPVIVQPIHVDVMQKCSDIMPLGPGVASILDLPPRLTPSEGLLRPLRLPTYLTTILMVQDILDYIGVVMEVLAL